MKTPSSPTLLATLIAILIIAQTGALAAPGTPATEPEPQDVIVILQDAPDADPTVQGSDRVPHLKNRAQAAQQDLSQFIQSHPDIRARGQYWLTNAIHVRATPSAIRALKKRPDVKDVVPDIQLTLLDTTAPTAPTTWGLNKIDAPDAWGRGITGKGVTVAVVDTGVDYTHPDLDQNIWVNTDEIPDNGVDDDGNGYIDDYRGWDFGDEDNDPMDTHSHGTHVAGTIAGHNESGTGTQTGVAPDAEIMALKVRSASGAIYLSDMMSAVQYAVDNGADVVSMSLGTSSSQDTLTQSYTFVEDASASGVTVVIAAGNSGPGTDTITFPGTEEQALTAGATDSNDDVASFSSRGPVTISGHTYIKPDVSAPGVNIKSTRWGGSSPYTWKSGTSMATPHVSGVAALLLEADPELTPADVKAVLRDSARDIDSPGVENNSGWGRIRVTQALDRVASDPATPPSVSDLTLTPSVSDGHVSVEATLHAGTGTLTGAEYSLDTAAPWGAGTPLPAADGAHDSATETISTPLDLTALPDGTHTFHLTARNSDGTTSDASTSFTVDTTPPTIDSSTTRYADGQTGAKPGDTVTLEVTSGDADHVTLDASPINGPEDLPLTDAGTVWTTDVTIDTIPTGTYTLTAAAADALNNTATAALTVAVDDEAPTATLTTPGDGDTATGTITVAGTATDPSSLKNWTLTRGTNLLATGTSPVDGTLATWNTTVVQDGTHFLRLRATDGAGNSAEDTVAVTVDNTGPFASASVTYPGDQTRARDGQTLTVTATARDTSVVDSVVLDASAVSTEGTVDLTRDGDVWTGAVSPDRSVTGSFDLPVTATDIAGNTRTAVVSVVLDNEVPAVSLVSPVEGDTVSGSVSVTGTATDTALETWSLASNDGTGWTPLATGTSPADGTLTTLDTTALPDGDLSLRLSATDDAGNTAQETVTVTVDNVGPGSLTTAVAYPDGQTAARDGQDLTVTITPSDPGDVDTITLDVSAVSTQGVLDLTRNGDVWTGAVSPDRGASGSFDLLATATDGAGNDGTTTARINLDNDAPTATLTSPADSSLVTGALPVSGTATDPTGLKSWSLTLTDATGTTATLATGTSPVDGTLTTLDTDTLPDGTHTLTLRTTDHAGTTAEDALTLKTDTTGPTLTASVTYPGDQTRARDGQTLTVTATAHDEFGVDSVVLDASAVSTEGTVALTRDGDVWTGAVSPDRSVTGSFDLPVTATDVAGNTRTTMVTVVLDNEVPAVSLVSPVEGDTVSGSVSVTGTATDTALETWSLASNDGTGWTPLATGTSPADGTLATWDTTTAPDGTHTLVLRATDAAGNTAETTTTVTVDNTGPGTPSATVTYPDGQSWARDGQAITIRLDAPDPADVRSVTLDASPLSTRGTLTLTATENGTWTGAVTPDRSVTGSFDLVATVTDTAGNSDTGVATARVDNAAPTATLTSPTDGALLSGTVAATGTGTDAQSLAKWDLSRDTESGWTTIATGTSPIDGALATLDTTTLPDGTHTLRLTATDDAGNTAEDTAAVTVDNTGPTLTASVTYPGDQTRARDGQVLTVTATAHDTSVVDSVALDASAVRTEGTVDLTRDGDVWTGAVTPDRSVTGSFDLPVTATDVAGNTRTTTVTVALDNDAPTATITTPSDGQVLDGSVTVTGTATDSTGLTSWALSSNDGTGWIPLATGTSPVDGDIATWTPSDGTNDLRLTATDEAGNTAETTVTVTVNTPETEPPRIPSVTGPADWVTDHTPLPVTVTATDASGVTSVALDASAVSTEGTLDLTRDGDVWSGVVTPDRGVSGSFDLPLVVEDANDNRNTSADITLRIDNAAPTAPDLTATDLAADETGRLALTWGTATDPHSGLAEYRVYTAPEPFTDPASAKHTATTTNTSLTLTGHTDQALWIAVLPVDNAGNQDALATPTEATPRDDVAPRITNVTPANTSRTKDHAPTISATLIDASLDPTATTLHLDGTNVTTNTTTTETNLAYTPSTPLDKGTHTVTVTATDTSGNTATHTWTFEVYGNQGGNDKGNKGGNGPDKDSKKDTDSSGGGTAPPAEDPANIETRHVDYIWSVPQGERQHLTFAGDEDGTDPVVRRVSFTYGSIADDVRVDLQELKGPTTLRDEAPPGTAFRHFNLYVDLPLKSHIETPELQLAVDRFWLYEQGGDPDNLRLATWDPDAEKWTTIPVTPGRPTGTDLLLTAHPLDFSQYALTYVEPRTAPPASAASLSTEPARLSPTAASLSTQDVAPETTPTRRPLRDRATERPATANAPGPGPLLATFGALAGLYAARRD